MRTVLIIVVINIFMNLLCSFHTDYCKSLSIIERKHVHSNHLSSLYQSKTSFGPEYYSFLINRDEKVYISSIQRLAKENIQSCLQTNKYLMEIDFPASRKSDIGVGVTLDLSIEFVIQLADQFKNFGRELWILLPDKKEAVSLRKKTDQFTIGSFDAYPKDSIPKLIFIVNPGFNVDEYINIPKIRDSIGSNENVPTIIINGNLNRIRNGYYPRFFYPKLYELSKTYYNNIEPVIIISPISINGNRFGAFIVKIFKGSWQLLVRSKMNSSGLEVIENSEEEFSPQDSWKIAKEAYSLRFPSSSMF